MTTQPPTGYPEQPSHGDAPMPGWPSPPSPAGPLAGPLPAPQPGGTEARPPRGTRRHDWRIGVMAVAVVALVIAGVLVYVRAGRPASKAPRARLESALTATNAAVTADVTLNVKAGFAGITFDVTGSGSVDFASHAASLDMHAFGHTISVVEANSILYLKVGSLVGNQFPGKTWVRMPMSAFTSAHGNALFVTDDPATMMSSLLKLGATVTPIGTATIDGTRDQGYRINLTLGELRAHASELPPSARSLFATPKLPATATVSSTMYVNPTGQLQATHVLLTATATGHPVTVAIDVTMSHFGAATVPAPPPATQTVTYSQMKGSLGSGTLPLTFHAGAQVT